MTHSNQPSSLRSDVFRQALLLALALAQALVGLVLPPPHAAGEAGGAPVRALIQPIDLTFAIWLPIFVACVVHAALALQRGRRARPLVRAVAWPLALAFASTTAFEATIALGVFDAAQWLIGLLFVSSALAFRAVTEACREDVAAGDGWLVGLPVGLLFGWATAASIVTVAAVARRAGASVTAETLLSVALVALGGVAGAWLVLRARAGAVPAVGVALAAALVWAFVGIAAAASERAPIAASAAAVGALASFVATWIPTRATVAS